MSISGVSATPPVLSTQNTYSANATTNVSSNNPGVTGSSSSHGDTAFKQDLIQSLQDLGLNFSNSGSNKGSSTSDLSGSSNNIDQLMQAFLHSLQQALNQSGDASGSDKDHHDDVNINININISGSQNGHDNLINDLSKLIDSLSNGDKSGGANSSLKTDFTNLVNASGESSSTKSGPTLTELLFTMLDRANDKAKEQNSSGSIISTQV